MRKCMHSCGMHTWTHACKLQERIIDIRSFMGGWQTPQPDALHPNLLVSCSATFLVSLLLYSCLTFSLSYSPTLLLSCSLPFTLYSLLSILYSLLSALYLPCSALYSLRSHLYALLCSFLLTLCLLPSTLYSLLFYLSTVLFFFFLILWSFCFSIPLLFHSSTFPLF